MDFQTPNFDEYQRQLDKIRQQYGQRATTVAPHKVLSAIGISGAKELQSKLAPGSSEIVMDENEDVFYVIAKDEQGVSPTKMTIGRFTLELEDPRETEYVTRKDFDALKDEIVALLKQGVKNE